jgi:predicted dehydrogenase
LAYILNLLAQDKLKFTSLISHRYPIERAVEAYACIKQGQADTYGVLLDYGPLPDKPLPVPPEAFVTRRSNGSVAQKATISQKTGPVRLGLIGCGGFTKGVHLPNLSQLPNLFQVVGAASRTGATAEIIARRSNIPVATSDYRMLLADASVEAVLIATRHASHAQIVLEALDAGKHVFVEKPMCLTIEEGQQIVAKAAETGLTIRVGFNRRVSPHLPALRQAVGTPGTRLLSCRVNIGSLPNDWSNTPAEGGRLLGEGVHFFDLCNWFMGYEPTHISAMVAGEVTQTNPNLMIQMQYPSGCIAQLLYTSLGHRGLGKEYFEAFGNGRSACSNDYQTLDTFGTKLNVKRGQRQDKGHLAELEEFAAALRGQHYPQKGADARAGVVATWMALAAYQSAAKNTSIQLTI